MDRDAFEALLHKHCSSTRRSPSDIQLEIEGAGTVFLSPKPTPETPLTPTKASAAINTSPVNSSPYESVSPRNDISETNGQSASPAAYRGNKYYKIFHTYRNLKPRNDTQQEKSESKLKEASRRGPFKGYGSIYQPINLSQKISEQGTQTDKDIDYQDAAAVSREIEKTNAHISQLYARIRSLESQLNTRHPNTPASSSDDLDPDVSTDVLKIQHHSNQSNDHKIKPVRVRRSSSRDTIQDSDDEERKPEEEKPRRQSVRETNPKDIEMVGLGNGFASVPGEEFKKINWSSYRAATRKLLSAVFTRDVLATHNLTGKSSPAFPGKLANKQLPPDLVNDIIQTVAGRCGVPEKIVRNSITSKCSAERRLALVREKKEKSQENTPPEL